MSEPIIGLFMKSDKKSRSCCFAPTSLANDGELRRSKTDSNASEIQTDTLHFNLLSHNWPDIIIIFLVICFNIN